MMLYPLVILTFCFKGMRAKYHPLHTTRGKKKKTGEDNKESEIIIDDKGVEENKERS